MPENSPRLFILPLLFCGIFSSASADVRMPAIFGSHMVLQQDTKLPVWGWADAGEAVTVTLGTDSAKATADSSGKWRVDLKPVATSSTPMTLTVAGKNKLTFDDVLVGEVWICSGQSNMEFDLKRAYNAATEIPKADDAQLRLFVVQEIAAVEPETEVNGRWMVCSPITASSFSAAGYFFGRELRHHLNRPVGLIGTYWGGTPAEAWTSLSGLQKDPPFTHYIDNYQQIAAVYTKAQNDYPALFAQGPQRTGLWQTVYSSATNEQLKQWCVAANQAKAAGQTLPVRPMPTPQPPRAPFLQGTPTTLYDGMLAPLIPYAIKGVIWYQGEANADRATEYQTLFPRMITDWREKWGQGDFPFLYVQLCTGGPEQIKPSEGNWAYLREAQAKALSLPNTGMAVTIDLCDGLLGHPRDKLDVGLRLALAAKHVAYGQEGEYSGPLYDSMAIKDNKILLTFKHAVGGLKMGVPPWTPTGTPPPPVKLTGFAIAGADKKWAWADAQIEGNKVVVSSPEVPAPVAVRYGWALHPLCNLYNQEGLPASPFRTDDWVTSEPFGSAPPPLPPAK